MKPIESFFILILSSIISYSSSPAMEIINSTDSPKTVEIIEYRPVAGGTFGYVILEAELQPGELRTFNYSFPDFLVEIKWGTRYEIPDEKFLVRESEASQVAQWQKIGEESLFPKKLAPCPIVIPPNTILDEKPNGAKTFHFCSGKQVVYDPQKGISLSEFIIKQIPYRLINKLIIEKVPSPIVTFSNRRAMHISLPQSHLKAVTQDHKEQLLIIESDDNSITLQMQCVKR